MNGNGGPPIVTTVDMGYGHFRAARALASALGVPVVHADRAPLASPREQALWRRSRVAYECGAGFKQRDARFAGEWIADLVAEGAMADAAWAGFLRLPKFGLYGIPDAIGAPPPANPP